MKNLTLEDVARKAGVSRSTVSRVINDHPHVKEHVRWKVWRVIRETGYQPHFAARSLAAQRSGIIGLVIPREARALFTDPYLPRLIQGISHACNRNDYILSLFALSTEEEENKLYPRISRQGMLDGLVIQAAELNEGFIHALINNDVPLIFAGRPIYSNVSFIDIDNVKASSVAVEFLIAKNHRRIGMISGPLTTTAGLDRLEGYKRALSDSGIMYDGSLVFEGNFSEESGYWGAKTLLERSPDAIFAASDAMAFGVMRACRELGVGIPEDLSVMGFDDLPAAKASEPPLTTIRQPIKELGERLIDTLVAMIDRRCHTVNRIVLDTELIERETVKVQTTK